MKTLVRLFLALVYLSFCPALVLAANTITNITFSPPSPSGMLTNERVNIAFDYTTDAAEGVRIFGMPYTGASVSPNWAINGSMYMFPYPSGSGTGFFTITSGNVVVDRIRFRMTNSDLSIIYMDFYVNVSYTFGNSITNIQLTPSSPATLPFGNHVDISFDYAANSGDSRIFVMPYTLGSPTPNFGVSGSPLYPSGSGSGGGFVTITSGNVVVDQIRVWMTNSDQSITFVEFYINVHYRFGSGNLIWYVNKNAAGTQTGSGWFNAFHHLQDALSAAEAGDEIWVAQETYRPDQDFFNPNGTGSRSASFALKNGVTIYGGFAGNETNLSERNWRVNKTILSGDLVGNDGPNFANNADNSYHVVSSSGNDLTAMLDGFVITAGHAEGDYPNYIGGGLFISSGSATIRNCIFRENMAGSGGGLADWSTDSSLISECIFLSNQATGAGGGGNLQLSNPSLINCQFLNNSAATGGGVYSLNNANSPTISNCIFSGNHATLNGGAIYNTGVGSLPNPAPPILQNDTFYANTALSNGGAILNNNGNDAVIDSCIFWDNSDASGSAETDQIVFSGTPSINYTCLQNWTGALGGTGNIGQYPAFINADGMDGLIGTPDDNLHLLPDSPCMNTGNPAPALNDPDSSRNDMGAYGGPWADQNSGSSLSGSGFIFTQIGNIPTSEITQSNVDPTKLVGHANVAPAAASALSIPVYTNSPFGSKVWVYGLFGRDDPVRYYQVLIGPWVGDIPPTSADFTPLTETLVKVMYSYDNVLNKWTHQYVSVGPQTVGGIDNIYLLTTPLLGSGFWSNMDLRMILDTGKFANGKYTLKIKGFDWQIVAGGLVEVTPDNSQEVILAINNSGVEAVIHKVKYDPANPSYIPATDGQIPECGIINLTSPQENLRFNITARHPDGYLRQYVLDDLWGKNNYGGVINAESYNPAVHGTNWSGVTNILVVSGNASPPLPDWQQCAYQFRLRAWANVTNGYSYIYSSGFSDHYYLDLTGGSNSCSTADLNRDGIVNFGDLAILGIHWLETCQ